MSFVSAVTDWAATYPYHALASVSFLYVICLTVLRGSRRNSKRLPYPPGPKGYPVIGNLLDAPTDKPWLTYDEWGKTYGEPSDTWYNFPKVFHFRRYDLLQSARTTIPSTE